MKQRWFATMAVWAVLAGGVFAQQPAPAPDTQAGTGAAGPARGASSGRGRSRMQPQPDPVAEANPELQPSALLQRAYAIARDLPLSNRVSLLMRLADAASRIDPQLAKSWADELFQSARELSNPVQRGQSESRAVEVLASVDIDHALEVFRQMDADTLAGTDGLPLDSRSIAARSLFAAVLRKKGVVALPLLQQEAQRLAESGTYPYSALASGVNQLGRMDAGLAETVFADSLAAYQQSSPTLAGNADFVNMLRLNRGPAAHADVQQAVTTVVNNLLAHPADSDQEKLPQPIQYQGATVDNPTDFLLLQLMPVARELQPDLLDHIAQSRPALGKAANAVSAMPRESWFPGQLGNSAAAATNPERAAVNRIQGAAASDPKQALAMANTQQDPLARSQALAAVASGMASKDPQQASQVLDDAQKAAEKIDDQRKELQALIAMAIASNRMNNQVVLRDSLARGFVLGDELLRQQQNEHPEQPPSDQGLSALVRAGVRPQLELTVAGIETLQNPQVKAQLLVIAAQSMPRRRAAPKSPAPAAVAEKPAAPAPLHPQ